MTQLTENCPSCQVAAEIMRARREVPVGRRRVVIDDEWMKCRECDEEFYTSEQADQLHRRSIEQVRLVDGLLPPAEIKRIRGALGLTQREFEELLGTGEKTCVRWESGRVCQSVAADRLMRLVAANRENVRILAGVSGVSLSEFALLPGPRLVSAEHLERGLAALPEFPQQPPAVFSVGGTQEAASSMSNTEEHAVIEAAHQWVTKQRVPASAQLRGVYPPGGYGGH